MFCTTLTATCSTRATFGGRTGSHNLVTWLYTTSCSRQYSALAQRPRPSTRVTVPTFERVGVPKAICNALQKAFPDVLEPTPTQQELIHAMISGRDVFMKDRTGSGKSFGLLLALLSMRRHIQGGASNHVITSLMLVPHRDLAYQLHHWAARMHQHLPGQLALPSLAQVVVRDSSTSMSEKIAAINRCPPHVLIATPQALWDLYEEHGRSLRLDTLSAVVVDEVDYLVEVPSPNMDKYHAIKLQRQIRRHPGPTRQLLDVIYRRTQDEFPKLNRIGLKWTPPTDGRSPSGLPAPQLVLSSATFRAHSTFLFTAGLWLKGRERRVARVSGNAEEMYRESVKHEAKYVVGGTRVQHHVLVVSDDGTVRNVKGAEDPPEASTAAEVASSQASDEGPVAMMETDAASASHDPELMEGLEEDMLPYRLNMLETVAEAFALDVPRVALLIIPAPAPLKRVVEELQRFGVDAHGLDVARREGGGAHLAHGDVGGAAENPTLLVCTEASTRGLDLPELSHVFLLGEPLPEEAPIAKYADTYLHAAGRVGRFGRGGKVVTVVGARRRAERKPGKKMRGWVDEPDRILTVLRRIGVTPTRFEHWERWE